MTTHAAPWTIDELGARVALALSAGYEGAPSGRVRDVPDRRTIRYYTTLGLIDRPAEMRGRTALYGRRHLLQLVAIKRLQAHGLTLAEVQGRLLGRSDAELNRLARLPREADAAAESPPAPEPRSETFWRDVPPPAERKEPAGGAPADGEAAVLQGVRLAGGVTLLFPAARPPDDDDIQAIRAASALLLKVLDKRRLLRPRSERRSDDPDVAAAE